MTSITRTIKWPVTSQLSGSTNYKGLINYGTLSLGTNVSLTDNKFGTVRLSGASIKNYNKITSKKLYGTISMSVWDVAMFDVYLGGTTGSSTSINETGNFNYNYTGTLNDTYTDMGVGFYSTIGSMKISNMYLEIIGTVNYYDIKVSTQGSGVVHGSGSYENNSTVTLTAEGTNDYVFSKWSDGSTKNPRSFTATSDVTYTAYFIPKIPFDPITTIQTDSDSFWIYGRAKDMGNGINRVQFPTWTTLNDQDDLITDWSINTKCSGEKGTWNINGTEYNYRFQVKISDHNNEYGLYITHIYPYDNLGQGLFANAVGYDMQPLPKAYIGTSQVKEIYIGTQKVKQIYVGTTKVYG